MKTIRTASLDEAIWAHLAGDHAVKKHLPPTEPLVAAPDFSSEADNAARSAELKRHRSAGHSILSDAARLEWVELEPADLLCCWTPWGPALYEGARGYELLLQRRIAHWGPPPNPRKDPEDAERVNRMRETVRVLPDASSFNEQLLFDVRALEYSFSRTVWRRHPTNPGWQLVDGTHRMLAVAWSISGTGVQFPYLRAIVAS